METKVCAKCGKALPEKADKCPACGETVEEELRCPKCGGANIIPISGMSKAATVAKWGIFSIGKAKAEHRCRDCGHRF
ncbi:MAG: zinc ribbon domain-containing protein [Oscillospiraceae bacterium]|nr:zinc ribbon domain-containing protein [Oscillospiraceae bacterium]MCR5173567.1 zinc ribbon domain-containing protein [Oscillospiraceae bacterium]